MLYRLHKVYLSLLYYRPTIEQNDGHLSSAYNSMPNVCKKAYKVVHSFTSNVQSFQWSFRKNRNNRNADTWTNEQRFCGQVEVGMGRVASMKFF